MSKLLTFEMSDDKTEIEIHGDKEGLIYLVGLIEKVIKYNTHDHLMTPSWAGNELSEEAKGKNTHIINKVTIGIRNR